MHQKVTLQQKPMIQVQEWDFLLETHIPIYLFYKIKPHLCRYINMILCEIETIFDFCKISAFIRELLLFEKMPCYSYIRTIKF